MKTNTLLLLCLLIPPVFALQISGFGTFGPALTDTSPAYEDNTNHSLNFDKHSKFGLNFNAPISNNLTAVGQVLYRYSPFDTANKFEMDWAFVSYNPFEKWQINVGKQKTPFWIISDHYDVGFLYPWSKPPLIIYRMNPVNTFTGIFSNYAFSLSDIDGEIGLYGGNAEIDSTIIDVNGTLWGLSLKLIRDNLTIRGSFSSLEVNTRIDLLSSNLLMNYYFTSLAAKLEKGSYYFLTEFAAFDTKMIRNSSSFEALSTNWAEAAYITAGINGTLFSPHLTYGYANFNSGIFALATLATSPQIKNKMQVLILGLNIETSLKSNVKLEIERDFMKPGHYGLFAKNVGREANLYSITLNFIF